MAVTLTKEFRANFVLFVVACVALGLSIWAFATPCKKDGFGNLLQQDCSKIPWCDHGGMVMGNYCLGACYAGCPEGTYSTGQKCKKSVCWPNFSEMTDVCYVN